MANTVEANVKINARADVSELNKLETSIDDIQGALERLSQGSAFDNIDEEIKDVSKDTNDYSGILQALAKQLGLSNAQASGLAKTLGATSGEAAAAGAAIGVIVGILKIYVDRLNEAENALIKFGEGALDAGVSGVEFFVDAIHTLVESLEEALSKMEEFAEAGAEIQTAYFNTFTILGSEAGNEVASFADKLQELYGLDGSQLVVDMQSIVAAAGSLGVSTGDAVKATENMTIMANNLSMIAGSFEKASNDIGNAISKGFVGRTSSLYVLMTKEEKEALKDLGSEVERYNYIMSLSGRIKERYVQFLGTEAGQLMLLKQQYGQLVGNISQLALGLYAKIAPVLTKLIQLANIALTFIMRVFNIDLKGSADVGTSSIADGISNSMKKAGDSSKKAAKDIKKSTKDTSKSIKELERQVASFDDVIQIKDNKANDDLIDLGDLDTGLDDIGDLDDGINDLIGDFDLLGDAIDNSNHEFDDFLALLEEGKYLEAGKWLANWLDNQLRSIPWDDIQAKAKKAGHDLAEILNGFNSNKQLWWDIGNTIAQALNTAVDFLLEFAKEFDFKQFGEDLGIAWKSFWQNLDAEAAGEMIYEWIKGAFEAAEGFFSNFPITNMVNKIVQIMTEFFSNIKEEDLQQIKDTIFYLLTDVFNGAFQLVSGLLENSDKLIEVINAILDGIVNWLNNGGDASITNIANAILKFIEKIKDSGIIDKAKEIILRVLNNAKFGELLAEISDIAMQVWAAKMQIQFKLWWEKVKAFFRLLDIPGALQQLGDLLEAGIVLLGVQIWEAIKNAWNFGEALADIVNAARINLLGALAAIALAVTGIIMGWIDKLDGIEGNFLQQFNDFKESIKKIFDPESWKKIGRDAFNGLLNGIKEIVQKIKDFINTHLIDNLNKLQINIPSNKLTQYAGIAGGSIGFHIPHLATGGIVNSATNAIIGEAGREAVLPLERNTGWMDVLAEKIAGINGGGNNTPVVIDMSAANKPVYTRSEYLAMADIFAEAMKARGVAVSMEY